MTTITSPTEAHPRFLERWTDVYYENLRARNLKLIGVAAVVMLILMVGAFTHSRFLDVDEVRVIGAETLVPDDVRELAGIDLGAPLVRLDLDAAAETIAGLPRVAAVTTQREWNGTVTFQIEERAVAAQFRSADQWIRVAGDGVVVEITTLPLADVPVVAGAMFESEPGWQVPTEVREALRAADAMPADVATVVESVGMSVDSLRLNLVGGGIVDVGDSRDIDDKYVALRTFLSTVELRCLSVLDVRAPSVPVVTRRTPC